MPSNDIRIFIIRNGLQVSTNVEVQLLIAEPPLKIHMRVRISQHCTVDVKNIKYSFDLLAIEEDFL